MKWFNNLKVSTKVLLSCLVFMFVIIAITGQSYFATERSNDGFKEFYNDKFMPVRWLNRTMRNVLQRRIDMLQAIEASQEKNYNEMNKRLESAQKLRVENADLLKKYMDLKMDPKEKKLADEFMVLFNDLGVVYQAFEAALLANNQKLALQKEEEWLKDYRPLREKLDGLIALQADDAKILMDEMERAGRQGAMLLMILFAFSIVAGVIITIILTRSVAGPVRKGLMFAQKIADGDLTERIDLDQKDELGQLGNALNKAADNLENMVSNIIVASQNLAQAVDQISSGNQNLSQRTSEQASSLEEIASTIEEASATINQNADNSNNANHMSSESSRLAKEGGAIVMSAVQAIIEVNQSSKKISEIITVINEISFQTNLLALNAAVEAARAGEQGRGFAVVAGEVRNLAQRSGTAAKEIGVLIKDSTEKVNIATDLANKSGEALNVIVKGTNDVGKMISEIAASTLEQKQGMNQINIAITEMDTMTQQNAALVEETASASEEMASQAREMLEMMKAFKIRDIKKQDVFSIKHKEIHLKSADSDKKAGKSAGKQSAISHLSVNNGHKSESPDSGMHSDKSTASMKQTLKDEGFEEF